MDKDRMERVFAKGGVKPIARAQVGDHDVFIGEGFSMMPHTAYRKFGVDANDFPCGMFVTWWWIGKDEKLHRGRPLFFDVFHNPEYDTSSKKLGRKNAAIRDAKAFLTQEKKIHARRH